jgi:hypothetical protein
MSGNATLQGERRPADPHQAFSLVPSTGFRRKSIFAAAFAVSIFLILQLFSGNSSSSFLLSSSSSSGTTSSEFHMEKKNQCKYNENNDPAAAAELFYLQTISGVHYDGGHWFHVAENFMVQHSILRASHGEGKTPEVYFLTDRGERSLRACTHLTPPPLSLSEFQRRDEWRDKVHASHWTHQWPGLRNPSRLSLPSCNRFQEARGWVHHQPGAL